jgi:hypothetical protein
VIFHKGQAQVALSDANEARQKAFNWLISQWIQPKDGVSSSQTGGWDESNTARIVTGLQLIDSGWIFNNPSGISGPVALKQMNSEILAGLVKSGNMTTITGEEGAEYINALLATCQDPQDFFGHNLVNMLKNRIERIPSGAGTKNVVQVIAASLALCNAGVSVPMSAIQRINSELKPSSGNCPYCVEASSLAIVAMKCFREQRPTESLIQGINTRQIAYVKDKQDQDGGFGNLFATTLAVQAANAVGTVNLPVNVASALKYIMEDQDDTGSFGNPVLTAFILPTLIGRSIADVKTTQCKASRLADSPLPSGHVRVVLSIEDNIYAQRYVDFKTSSLPGKSILDVMNEQAAKHPKAFKFTTGTANGGTQLTGVNSVSNDTKNNWSWRVFMAPAGSSTAQIVSGGIDKTTVQTNDKIIFRFGRD